jgi:hypothetical protein
MPSRYYADDTIEEAARVICEELYEASFAGKTGGRFMLDRDELTHLLGRTRLRTAVIDALTDACLARGIVMIDLDNRFAFIRERVIRRWRPVPNRVLAPYLNTAQEADAATDDEE